MTRDPSPIRGEVLRQARKLGQHRQPAAGTAGTPNPAERDLRARLRHALAEELRMDEYDAEATLGLCQGECSLAPGSTRGGRLLGDGSVTGGMVVVDAHGDPLTELAEVPEPGTVDPDAPQSYARPCIDCNPDRYRAWVFGYLAGDKKRKSEPTAADRAAAAERRRQEPAKAFL